MSDPILLPTPDEIAARIRDCREELAALKKLQRMTRTARVAHEARERRQVVSAQSHTKQGDNK